MSQMIIEDEHSLEYFEKLREQHDVKRVNNVDVITTSNGNELGLCHMPVFIPAEYSSEVRGAMGVFLAIKHLNSGDGSVIPEIEGLNERCNIRFTTEIFDTEASERVALNKLVELTRRDPENEQLPCAILGASRTASSAPMAIINGIEGYPQFSHYATGSQLDDKSQYNLFGRVIPSDDGTAIPLIYYLRDILGVSHFGILHTNDAYGLAFTASLEKAIKTHAPYMSFNRAEIPFNNPTPIEIENAVKILSSTPFRHFFGVINNQNYNMIMAEAYKQGIAGPGYNWIFSDSMRIDSIGEQDENSPLALATSGISILSAQGGIKGMPSYDKFLHAWNELSNIKYSSYLESKLPASNQLLLDDLLIDVDPNQLTSASFLYDATIALGIGACEAKKDDLYFEGEDHYFNTINTTFLGSTGNIIFEKSTGSRDPTSALFTLTNLQKKNNSNIEISGKVSYSAVPISLFQNGKWESISPHIFADGSTIPPLSLPEVNVNYYHLGPILRLAGLILCAIILFLSTFFAGWTFYHRKGKIVTASQPVFLYLICFGTFIMGTAIIPLSFDDEIASQKGCTIACAIFPWLLTTGFCVSFSALFSKTWKLNKLFFNSAMRRIQVKTKDVILPMVSLFVANVIVLTTMTIMSPQIWTRKVTGVDIYGRTISSMGQCTAERSPPFIITLMIINLSALSITLYQAYKARHIKTILGETKYITMATSSMLLVFIMGIPVMIIAYDNPRALYFVEMFIIFIVCMSLILFTFWPKVRLNRKVQRGSINMQNVIREFAEQAHGYEFRKRSETLRSSIFPSITVQNMKATSFGSTSMMNEHDNNGSKKSSISIEEGKIDKELEKQSKSVNLEVLESNENKIMKETENSFEIGIQDRSNEFAELQEENAALKKELHAIEQLFAASA